MISNYTICEIKEFFKGALINDLKDGRYYIRPISNRLYQVNKKYGYLVGYIEVKNSPKTEPYVDKINGEIGAYCIYCKAKLNSKDKYCPDCFREIKEII